MTTAMTLRILADHDARPDADGVLPPAGLVKIDGDPAPTHQFGLELVSKGAAQGWLELDDPEAVILRMDRITGYGEDLWSVTRAKSITLHTPDGDVVYQITRQPGFYHSDNPAVTLGDALSRDEDGGVPEVEVFLGYDVALKTKKAKG